MKLCNLYTFLFIFCVYMPHMMFCIQVGSDSAISSESFLTFPSADADNTIRGFAFMNQGFSLEDSTTTCTFDSIFPLKGNIQLHGGTLWVLRDLVLHNVTTFTSLGDLKADNVQGLSLPSGLATLGLATDELFTFKNITVTLNSNIKLKSYVQFEGNCTIEGNGRILDLCSTASVAVGANSRLTLKDLRVSRVHNNNIRCIDDTGIIELNNTELVQNDTFTFDTGSIDFKNAVTILGTSTFFYESSQTSTINEHSTWCITEGIYLCIGRDSETLNEPLAFEDTTSILKLDNCTFVVPATGMQLTKGKLIFERNVNVEMQSTSTDTGIVIGNGNANDDAVLCLAPACSVNFIAGHFTYNNGSADKVLSSSVTARLIRHENSYISVHKNLTLPRLGIELISNTVPPMDVNADATLVYNESFVVLPDVEYDISSKQLNAFTYVLNGNDTIFFNKGSFPLFLSIQGTGNQIRGNGDITNTITLLDSASELIFSLNGFISKDIALNNGKVTLEHDISMLALGHFVGPGIVDLGGYTLYLSGGATTWSSPIKWMSQDGEISFNDNVSLSSTWTCNGVCNLEGNNHSLDLGTTGRIVIESGATLRCRNMRLENIDSDSITCVDDTSIIILDNIIWTQNSNYFLFDKGAIRFKNNVIMVGEDALFAYSSNMTSTLCQNSYVKLDTSFTFSYDPGMNAKNLLEFADNTATLLLKSASLCATSTGLDLIKGHLIVKGNSFISSEIEDLGISTKDKGITIGDGTSQGECFVTITGGAKLTLADGSLIYKNVTSDGWLMENNSSFLHLHTGTTLWLFEDIDVRPGIIEFDNQSRILRAPGKSIIGSIVPNGSLIRGTFTP